MKIQTHLSMRFFTKKKFDFIKTSIKQVICLKEITFYSLIELIIPSRNETDNNPQKYHKAEINLCCLLNM